MWGAVETKYVFLGGCQLEGLLGCIKDPVSERV